MPLERIRTRPAISPNHPIRNSYSRSETPLRDLAGVSPKTSHFRRTSHISGLNRYVLEWSYCSHVTGSSRIVGCNLANQNPITVFSARNASHVRQQPTIPGTWERCEQTFVRCKRSRSSHLSRSQTINPEYFPHFCVRGQCNMPYS